LRVYFTLAAGLLTLAVALFMGAHLRRNWYEVTLPNGLTRPILAMELAHSRDEVAAVLGTACAPVPGPCGLPREDNRAEMRWQQRADRVFIPIYSLFLLAIAWNIAARGRPWWAVALAMAFATAAAAVFDFREDARIDAVLDAFPNITDAMARGIRTEAYPKWLAVFVAAGLGGAAFLRARTASLLLSAIGWVTLAFALLTGTIGTLACLYGDDSRVEAAAASLGAEFALATLYFLLYHPLRAGTLQFLEALTNVRIFGRQPFQALARWPR
jgi:hypothetical protein